ncbi:MAG: hypothetical protein WBQ38_07695 [Ignavibacteria bacterium]|jgi:hypothetical protein|nr:hypothetical protein [Ignavibacteria bacterium]MBK7158517.1 hypothetical protein [Ignavibacteria bacterium]MBK7444910.1 hypothetical protein [Ignavibacteria bacterium]MBK8383553.1 hypothetical protein [Ignavibacteria bacterium]MBK9403377.1 hypothetical protein [Ignavibacteria bacterium]
METKNAELELSLIKKMMEDSRRLNIDNGIHYIFWGILVTIALLINYTMLLLKVPGNYIGLAWFILMLSGALIDGIIGRRQSKSSKVTTFTSRIMGSLWFASGIAMFMYGFLGTITKAYNPVFICPIISTSLGISYFTSGSIQQIKWLQNISFGWWAGAAIMFIFPSVHTLLIFAIMMICLQVIPGLILNKKSKQDLISPVL